MALFTYTRTFSVTGITDILLSWFDDNFGTVRTWLGTNINGGGGTDKWNKAANADTVGGFVPSKTPAVGQIPVIDDAGVLALPATGITIGGVVVQTNVYARAMKSVASGAAGAAITPNAWSKRSLNTTLADDPNSSGITIAASVISLPAGAYIARAITTTTSSSSGGGTYTRSQLRLYNTADSATLVAGIDSVNTHSGSPFVCDVQSHLVGYFTIAAGKTVELQEYIDAGSAATGTAEGPGSPINSGEIEIHTSLEFTKVG